MSPLTNVDTPKRKRNQRACFLQRNKLSFNIFKQSILLATADAHLVINISMSLLRHQQREHAACSSRQLTFGQMATVGHNKQQNDQTKTSATQSSFCSIHVYCQNPIIRQAMCLRSARGRPGARYFRIRTIQWCQTIQSS